MKNKIIDSKMFSYYQNYFHDGGIEAIMCLDNEIIFEMESAAIYTCDNKDSLPLSENNTIYGLLHAKNVVFIKKNGQFVNSLKMEYDCINLISFELKRDHIEFVGMWVKYGSKVPYDEEMFVCEVVAKEIYWENTANITDPVLLGKFMGLEGPPPYDYPPWYCEKYNIEPSGASKKNTGLGVQHKDEDAK